MLTLDFLCLKSILTHLGYSVEHLWLGIGNYNLQAALQGALCIMQDVSCMLASLNLKLKDWLIASL